jgi:hypothetical protein
MTTTHHNAESAPDPEEQGVPHGHISRHPNDGWPLADPLPLKKGLAKSFRALILALIPDAPAPQWDGMVDQVMTKVLQALRYMHPVTYHGFMWAVRLVDWAPIWRFRSFRRLRSMERARASLFLESLGHSRIALLRQLLMAVRSAVLAIYYDRDEVHKALDYNPVRFMEERVDLRHRMKQGQNPEHTDMLLVPEGDVA